MSEKEAKTKWCSHNLQYGYTENPGSWNRGGRDCNCLASDCMMWRWTCERGKIQGSDDWVPITGFCGLGGKP